MEFLILALNNWMVDFSNSCLAFHCLAVSTYFNILFQPIANHLTELGKLFTKP